MNQITFDFEEFGNSDNRWQLVPGYVGFSPVDELDDGAKVRVTHPDGEDQNGMLARIVEQHSLEVGRAGRENDLNGHGWMRNLSK